jgi:hypothetical protein
MGTDSRQQGGHVSGGWHQFSCDDLRVVMAPTLALAALQAASAISAAPAADHGLTLKVYANTALAGTPVSTRLLSSPELELPAAQHGGAWSAEVVGTVAFPQSGGLFNFSCDFVGTTLGFVWVDGHRVCNDGNASHLGW